MLSPIVPWPLDSGAYVRIFHLLRGLSGCHDVTFVAPTTAVAEEAGRALPKFTSAQLVLIEVSSWRERVRKWTSLASLRPYHVARFAYPEMARAVSSLGKTREFDLIYANFIYSLSYLPKGNTVPLVLDQHNVDREFWLRRARAEPNPLLKLFCIWNLSRTITYENSALKRFCAYVSVSDRDRSLTASYAGAAVPNFLVAPNGVDECYFQPAPRDGGEAEQTEICLGFMGAMELKANERAARTLIQEILPLVRSSVPHRKVRCLIIGRRPTAQVLDLGRRYPDVTVTGTVPDVRPHLNAVDIFVAPLMEGAGSKLRVLEAMASGLPIVATGMAVQGIDGIREHETMHIAGSPEQFAKAIVGLIEIPDERRRLGRNARNLVEERYGWDRIIARLGRDLENITRRRRSTALS